MTRPATGTPTRSTTRRRRRRTSSTSSTSRRSLPTAAAALLGVFALVACSKDSGSADELCQALGEGPGFATVFEGFDPTDATTALDQLRTARVDLGELKDAAPDEVRDDLQVEIDYVQALIDALEDLGPDADASEVATTVQTVTDAHPDVDEAAATLGAFAAKEC